MKIVMIKGNPRKSGITEMLCDFFADGIRSAGMEVDEVRLADFNIKQCIGCYGCAISSENKCVLKDDMPELISKVSNANILICATPVYFYAMTGLMKNFWDRCLPFICGYEKNDEGSWKNKTSFAVQNKKFVSINVGSGRFCDTYDAIVHTWNTIAKSMGFEVAANIVRSESLYFTHPNQKLEIVRRIKDSFFSAGRQLAQKGSIDKRTLSAISQNLSENDDIFAYNSNIFWQRLKSGSENIIQAKNQNGINDPRILLSEMRALFNPKKAPKNAVILFHFTDSDKYFSVEISNGDCKLSSGQICEEDLKITTNAESWAEFLNGRGRVMEQLARGEIVLDGNPHLFTRLKRFFDIEKK